MKKYSKLIIAAIVALIFIGTFVVAEEPTKGSGLQRIHS